MIHIGLSLLTVALESGAAHIGAFPSLMGLINDEMCKNLFMVRVLYYLCCQKYTRKNLTTCSKSANKPSTSCVRTACYKLSTSLEQAVNNLLQPC